MSIRFDIPQDLETSLRQRDANLDQAAREAFLVDLYRTADMTHHQLAEALGLDRYETDGVLKRHGVEYDLTKDELTRQLEFFRPERAS